MAFGNEKWKKDLSQKLVRIYTSSDEGSKLDPLLSYLDSGEGSRFWCKLYENYIGGSEEDLKRYTDMLYEDALEYQERTIRADDTFYDAHDPGTNIDNKEEKEAKHGNTYGEVGDDLSESSEEDRKDGWKREISEKLVKLYEESGEQKKAFRLLRYLNSEQGSAFWCALYANFVGGSLEGLRKYADLLHDDAFQMDESGVESCGQVDKCDRELGRSRDHPKVDDHLWSAKRSGSVKMYESRQGVRFLERNNTFPVKRQQRETQAQVHRDYGWKAENLYGTVPLSRHENKAEGVKPPRQSQGQSRRGQVVPAPPPQSIRVMDPTKKDGAVVKAEPLAPIFLSNKIWRAMRLWWNHEMSGKKCAKECTDMLSKLSGVISGGKTGGKIGGMIVPPFGTILGSVIGSVMGRFGANSFRDTMRRQIFDLPKNEASQGSYNFLGVPRTASNEEVNRAYRHKCLQVWENNGGTKEEFQILQMHMAVIKLARGEK